MSIVKVLNTALFYLLLFPYCVTVVQSTFPSSLSHDVMRDEVTVVIMCPEGAGILPVSLYEHRCRAWQTLDYTLGPTEQRRNENTTVKSKTCLLRSHHRAWKEYACYCTYKHLNLI